MVNNIKILWIEDDYLELMPLIKTLKKAGCMFDYAINELEAIEHLNRSEYNLIFLDIIIPEGVYHEDRDPLFHVGLKLLDQIVNEMNIKTPVIVISVVNDKEVNIKLNDLKVKKILFKGRILPSELKASVEAVLGVSL
jgi:DNA-binding response OmpR family regulator